jgi:hypothetical protein
MRIPSGTPPLRRELRSGQPARAGIMAAPLLLSVRVFRGCQVARGGVSFPDRSTAVPTRNPEPTVGIADPVRRLIPFAVACQRCWWLCSLLSGPPFGRVSSSRRRSSPSHSSSPSSSVRCRGVRACNAAAAATLSSNKSATLRWTEFPLGTGSRFEPDVRAPT